MTPEEAESNPRFHSEGKGCKLYRIHSTQSLRKCRTHKDVNGKCVVVSKTGWEIGWIYGTVSRTIITNPNKQRDPAYWKDYYQKHREVLAVEKLSPSSANYYRTILNSAFNFAIGWKKYNDRETWMPGNHAFRVFYLAERDQINDRRKLIAQQPVLHTRVRDELASGN